MDEEPFFAPPGPLERYPTISFEPPKPGTERTPQDLAWIASTDIQSCLTEQVPFPERTIMIGVNERVALAMLCSDRRKPPSDCVVPIANQKYWEQFESFSETYQRYNTAHRFLRFLEMIEQDALFNAMRYKITRCETKETFQTAKMIWDKLLAQDYAFKSVSKRLEPIWLKRLGELKHRQHDKREDPMAHPEERPPAAAITLSAYSFMAPSSIEPPGRKMDYRILACAVPTSTDQTNGWKETKIVIEALEFSVPIAVMNDTHVIFFYQPCGYEPDVLFADVYRISPDNLQLQKMNRRFIQLTKSMKEAPRNVVFACDFGNHGIAAIARGPEVILFDALAGVECQLSGVLLSDRCITSVEVVDSEYVTIGTTLGEVYRVRWGLPSSDPERQIYALSCAEPVFATLTRKREIVGNTIVAQCVLSVSIERDADAEQLPFYCDIIRPIAMDVCGNLLFMLTKYGFLHVRDLDTVGISRILGEPPKRAKDVALCPTLQHAYRGLKCAGGRVICLHPSGNIRVFVLGGGGLKK